MGIFNKERALEIQNSSFRVENQFDPETIFWVLTHVDKKQEIYMANNFKDISDDYDPIQFNVWLRTRRLADIDKSVKTRQPKILTTDASLCIRRLFLSKQTPEWELGIREVGRNIIEVLDMLGTHFEPLIVEARNLLITPGSRFGEERRTSPIGIENDGDGPRLSLSYSRSYIELGLDESQRFLLNDEANFAKVYRHFFETIEKVIKAIYILEDKDLPVQSLVFKPESKKVENSSLSVCGYCGSYYSVAETLKCPTCGGNRPT